MSSATSVSGGRGRRSDSPTQSISAKSSSLPKKTIPTSTPIISTSSESTAASMLRSDDGTIGSVVNSKRLKNLRNYLLNNDSPTQIKIEDVFDNDDDEDSDDENAAADGNNDASMASAARNPAHLGRDQIVRLVQSNDLKIKFDQAIDDTVSMLWMILLREVDDNNKLSFRGFAKLWRLLCCAMFNLRLTEEVEAAGVKIYPKEEEEENEGGEKGGGMDYDRLYSIVYKLLAAGRQTATVDKFTKYLSAVIIDVSGAPSGKPLKLQTKRNVKFIDLTREIDYINLSKEKQKYFDSFHENRGLMMSILSKDEITRAQERKVGGTINSEDIETLLAIGMQKQREIHLIAGGQFDEGNMGPFADDDNDVSGGSVAEVSGQLLPSQLDNLKSENNFNSDTDHFLDGIRGESSGRNNLNSKKNHILNDSGIDFGDSLSQASLASRHSHNSYAFESQDLLNRYIMSSTELDPLDPSQQSYDANNSNISDDYSPGERGSRGRHMGRMEWLRNGGHRKSMRLGKFNATNELSATLLFAESEICKATGSLVFNNTSVTGSFVESLNMKIQTGQSLSTSSFAPDVLTQGSSFFSSRGVTVQRPYTSSIYDKPRPNDCRYGLLNQQIQYNQPFVRTISREKELLGPAVVDPFVSSTFKVAMRTAFREGRKDFIQVAYPKPVITRQPSPPRPRPTSSSASAASASAASASALKESLVGVHTPKGSRSISPINASIDDAIEFEALDNSISDAVAEVIDIRMVSSGNAVPLNAADISSSSFLTETQDQQQQPQPSLPSSSNQDVDNASSSNQDADNVTPDHDTDDNNNNNNNNTDTNNNINNNINNTNNNLHSLYYESNRGGSIDHHRQVIPLSIYEPLESVYSNPRGLTKLDLVKQEQRRKTMNKIANSYKNKYPRQEKAPVFISLKAPIAPGPGFVGIQNLNSLREVFAVDNSTKMPRSRGDKVKINVDMSEHTATSSSINDDDNDDDLDPDVKSSRNQRTSFASHKTTDAVAFSSQRLRTSTSTSSGAVDTTVSSDNEDDNRSRTSVASNKTGDTNEIISVLTSTINKNPEKVFPSTHSAFRKSTKVQKIRNDIVAASR